MRDYHQEVYHSFKYFHIVFHEHFKDQYPSLMSIQDCCTRDKEIIENMKDKYGDDQYVDEQPLEILN